MSKGWNKCWGVFFKKNGVDLLLPHLETEIDLHKATPNMNVFENSKDTTNFHIEEAVKGKSKKEGADTDLPSL